MPATTIPPSAASTPPCAFAAITGAMNAKLEPVYDGTRFLRDQVEEDRPDAGEEDRRRDREAGQHRHQRGRAEHREDVLGAEAEHGRHVQPLVGPHHRARLYGAPVPVDLPNLVQTGSHIASPRRGRYLPAVSHSSWRAAHLHRRAVQRPTATPISASTKPPSALAATTFGSVPAAPQLDSCEQCRRRPLPVRRRRMIRSSSALRNCSVVRRAAAPISRWPTPASGPVTVASAS